MDDFDLLTVAEVAGLLRKGENFVYRLTASGKLPATKVGSHWRIRRCDYLAYITPTPAAEVQPRSQKDRIRKLLRSV